MKAVSFASGSKGNAYCVIDEEQVLLVDCGLCIRELKRRAESIGISLDDIAGVVLTHDHDDHIKGLKAFCRMFPDKPIFANLMTAEAVSARCCVPEDAFLVFENAQPFQVGPFDVTPFSIPHDTPDPVGYVVKAGDETYFHATDIGTPLDSIGVHLSEANIATLESNHDIELLFRSGRPPSLIQRISGPRGHLSNDQASELIVKFATGKLRSLALAHLSEDCNAPHFVERAVAEALASRGLTDLKVSILSQHSASVIS